MYAWIYRRKRELGGLGITLIPRVRAAVKLQARRQLLERWDEHFSNPRDTSGRQIVEAIRPRLVKWVEGRWRGVVKNDTGDNRPRMLRGLPMSHQSRRQHTLPPLRRGQGHGALPRTSGSVPAYAVSSFKEAGITISRSRASLRRCSRARSPEGRSLSSARR